MTTKSPFWDHIGLSIVEAKDGHSKIEVNVTENLYNYAGSVQGGVIAAMLDVASGSAVSSSLNEGQKLVTTDLTIHYVLPATGETLIGKGVLKHKGRTLGVANAEIYNDQGQLVALGSASFRIIE